MIFGKQKKRIAACEKFLWSKSDKIDGTPPPPFEIYGDESYLIYSMQFEGSSGIIDLNKRKKCKPV
jgi:hypothetical protein